MDTKQESKLIDEVLRYCSERATPKADEEMDAEHERALWNEIVAKFADRYDGDIMDIFSDYSIDIQRAMFVR